MNVKQVSAVSLTWKVQKHKKGWAVIRQEVGGYHHGQTTVIAIRPSKSEAEALARTRL